MRIQNVFLNNTNIVNIGICFIQMQCDTGAFKRFDLIINYCTALKICLL